jgi:predicted lipoprotein with Yx(FWY)xxD motif
MPRVLKPVHARSPKLAAATIAAVAGFATAAAVGIAVAKTFTIQVAKNAKVTDQAGSTTTENIVVTSGGRAAYTLSGDSASHPKCTNANGCFSVWPPVTVSSAKKLSAGPGVKGKLGVWHRDGLFQVTLAGHPLYRFSPDSQRDHATGEGLQSFGGTWHVTKAAGSNSTTNAMTMSTSTSCLYPPCY